MEDGHKLDDDIVKAAAWVHNTNVNKLGFSPLHVATGKAVTIPCLSTGNIATESMTEAEAVKKVIERMNALITEFRKVEMRTKLKECVKERSYQYQKLNPYVSGERVWYQNEDKNAWLGPAEVITHKGNTVWIIAGGNVKKVAEHCVQPFDVRVEDEVSPESVGDNHATDDSAEGMAKVDTNATSTTTKDDESKHKTTINTTNGDVAEPNDSNHPDKDIVAENTRSKSKVKFDALEDIHLVEVLDDQIDIENDIKLDKFGAFYMRKENRIKDYYETDLDPNAMFVVQLPVAEHDRTEVIEAKKNEIKNLEDFGTFDEVNENEIPPESSVIGSRWVVTEKEGHDGQKQKIKAQLVARGFQEEVKPQSDAPAAHKDSLKLFLAVTAQKDFDLMSLDIKAAFLQAKMLDRDVYLKPPKDVKKKDILWKLNRPLYGLDDASRKFWLKVREVFSKIGLKTIEGDGAFYYKHDGNSLQGMVLSHIDDFSVSGTKEFNKMFEEKVREEFEVSKTERDSFRFTGLDITKTTSSVELSMSDYIESINTVEDIRKDHNDSPLTEKELKQFRGYTGKVSWLAENVRPDLSYTALNMAKKSKEATIADLKNVNRVVKKMKEGPKKMMITKVIEDDEDLEVVGIRDASFKVGDKSIGGNTVSLVNKKDGRAVPVYWT